MKKELKFYTALPLYIMTTCLMWGMTLGMLYFIVISYDASFEWWLLVILLYGGSIFLSVGLYPRLMSKIHLDETGIRKTVFRKSKARFIKWEDVRDVQVLTRPNGYAYLLVSDSKITCKSFEEVLKEKNVEYAKILK